MPEKIHALSCVVFYLQSMFDHGNGFNTLPGANKLSFGSLNHRLSSPSRPSSHSDDCLFTLYFLYNLFSCFNESIKKLEGKVKEHH